jgi:hypothetical protein
MIEKTPTPFQLACGFAAGVRRDFVQSVVKWVRRIEKRLYIIAFHS